MKQQDYLPTPEEIKEACLKLRESWSEEEFFKRARIKKTDYTIPICDTTSYDEFTLESNIYRT